MEDFTTPKQYLRIQTGVPVTIKSLGKKEWKGKEKFVVTFQDDQGALIDAGFQLPMNEITKKQYAKLLKAASVADAKELQGKRIGIQINRSEYNGKDYFNPSHFFPIHYFNDGTGNAEEDDNFNF
jgi:hypothetical protein